MIILLVVLHVFVCLFLIVVILLQAGRGQGLSWGVFGGSPQSIFGTKTASFLTRVTTVCASVFLISCIILNIIETRKSKSLMAPLPVTKVDLDKIKQALDEAAKAKPAETKPAAETAPTAVPTPAESTPQTPVQNQNLPEQNKS